MDVKLYRNNSSEKVVQKDLTLLTTLGMELLEPTDIINPVLIVENDLNVFAANYASTTDLGSRFYFITGMKILDGARIELRLKVDVLQTYASNILNQRAIVSRQQNDVNQLLSDNRYAIEQRRRVQVKNFPASFTADGSIIFICSGN